MIESSKIDLTKFFCKKCNNFSPTDKCQFCGAKKLRKAENNDPVYIATQSPFFAGMLEEALLKNDIPCIKKEKHGGILKLVGLGTGIEEFDIFVPIGAYKKAKELLEVLFKPCQLRLSKNPKLFKQGTKSIKK